MTKKQANQWLKDVTGRKIRLNSWKKDEYIIPTGKWSDKPYEDPSYWGFECINENNEKDWYCIREGFSEDKYGDRWEYVENFERYLELLDL